MAGQRPRAGQGRRLSISQGRFHLSLSRGDGAEEPLAAVLGGTGWPRRRSPSRRSLCNLWSYESKTNPFVANASPAEDTSLGSAVFGSESRLLPPALMAGFSAADQNQMRVRVSPRKETGGAGGFQGLRGGDQPSSGAGGTAAWAVSRARASVPGSRPPGGGGTGCGGPRAWGPGPWPRCGARERERWRGPKSGEGKSRTRRRGRTSTRRGHEAPGLFFGGGDRSPQLVGPFQVPT